MPSLPQRKVGIVACSGEEMAEGTVTRLAALKVLEDLRPAETVTICLPLFLAGGEGDRAFAKFYPTIAVDGCEKRCAARATELYSNKPAASLLVDDIIAARGLARPQGMRRLSADAAPLIDALADEIAAEVDRLMDARWSRSEGVVLEAEADAKPAVNSAACACGSGVPVTTVEIDGRAIQIMALEPIMEMAYAQKPGFFGETGFREPPAQLMNTVRLYNTIPAEDLAIYEAAVDQAWQSYCASKETSRG
ncbi:MAG: putative zinc-binding protein [Anaerolineae bacterium]|nr:putative zinc-binding protein [Anaerolineae bacterium]